MKSYYDGVVVGAGISGLTAAAYLAKAGLKVLVCEKQEKIGGLAQSFWMDGCSFDAGIRAFENSGILFPMLKELGISLEFVHNPLTLGIGNRVITLDGEQGILRYKALLQEIFPEEIQAIEGIFADVTKVKGYMDVLYGIDNPLFVDLGKDPEYLMKTILPWLFRYQTTMPKINRLQTPIYTFLERHTKNIALVDLVAQHFFRNTPTSFALSYFGQYLDYRYPIGGTGALSNALQAFLVQREGEVVLNTEVIKVNPKLQQLWTKEGTSITYGSLIWCGDQTALYNNLDGENWSKGILRQKQRNKEGRPGNSVFSLYLSTNCSLEYVSNRSGAHAFYTPTEEGLSGLGLDSFQEAIQSPGLEPAARKEALFGWLGEYLRRTTFEISCPALRDPTLAAPGQSGIIISTLIEYELFPWFREEGYYEEAKDFIRNQIIDLFDQGLFDHWKEQIRETRCATPLTLETLTGNLGGAITGWAFDAPTMPAENRFTKIARSINTPIPKVYQGGQWTFSPSGLPISILTGKLAADAVVKDYRKTLKKRKKLTEE